MSQGEGMFFRQSTKEIKAAKHQSPTKSLLHLMKSSPLPFFHQGSAGLLGGKEAKRSTVVSQRLAKWQSGMWAPL